MNRKCDANGEGLFIQRDQRSLTGLYALHQCDEGGCFCVDEKTGEEKVGTRTVYGEEPKCEGMISLSLLSHSSIPLSVPLRGSCPPLTCTLSCSSGFELSSNGCPSCKCKDPCGRLNCPKVRHSFILQDNDRWRECSALSSLSIVSTLKRTMHLSVLHNRDVCYTICNKMRTISSGVPNLCPMGEPLLSSSGSPKSCTESHECEPNHFCHDVSITFLLWSSQLN